MTEDRADGEQTRFTVRTTAEAHFAWLRTRSRRADDDVLDTDRSLADWLRLYDRPVLRPDAAAAGNAAPRLSRRAASVCGLP